MTSHNKQLNLALAYWKYQRDEAHSNLEIYLNKPVASGNVQAEINEFLRKFSEAQRVVETIEIIISTNTYEPEELNENQENKS